MWPFTAQEKSKFLFRPFGQAFHAIYSIKFGLIIFT